MRMLGETVVMRVELVGVEVIQQHDWVNLGLEALTHYLHRGFLIRHLIACIWCIQLRLDRNLNRNTGHVFVLVLFVVALFLLLVCLLALLHWRRALDDLKQLRVSSISTGFCQDRVSAHFDYLLVLQAFRVLHLVFQVTKHSETRRDLGRINFGRPRENTGCLFLDGFGFLVLAFMAHWQVIVLLLSAWDLVLIWGKDLWYLIVLLWFCWISALRVLNRTKIGAWWNLEAVVAPWRCGALEERGLNVGFLLHGLYDEWVLSRQKQDGLLSFLISLLL